MRVKIDPVASRASESENVDVRLYNVIYELINDVKGAMGGLLEPVIEEEMLGKAEVKQAFQTRGGAAEKPRLLGGVCHAGSQHGQGMGAEQVAALGARERCLLWLGLEKAPQLAQLLGWTGSVEGEGEILLQAVALTVLAQQPQNRPGLWIGIKIQQPAGQLSHVQPVSPGSV